MSTAGTAARSCAASPAGRRGVDGFAAVVDAVQASEERDVLPNREVTIHRLVGESSVLQTVLRSVPSVVDVDVRAVGEYAGGRSDPLAALSERQREAVEVALELGYFEQPRRATHEDVAERMGVASSTASEHLQKAQANLVRAVLPEPPLERERR